MFESRIQELRIERGINMKQAAQALNIPYTTYVGYEKGDREPDSTMLIRLADFYNSSIDYLLGKIDEITDNKINIHPNPTNDRLYIEAEVEIEDVVIYDVYGRRLQSIVNNQQSLSIDVAGLKSGIYFIKINTNKGNIVKRIIKN